MKAEELRDRGEDSEKGTEAQFTDEGGPGEAPAWEQIDTGRYMPRRIKGSYKGRALG